MVKNVHYFTDEWDGGLRHGQLIIGFGAEVIARA
jgi:hypothetical protein